MNSSTDTILVPSRQMLDLFSSILARAGFDAERARQCADIFTNNSVDGVYTHGVNRFARFVRYVKEGVVNPAAVPSLKNAYGGLEQWDGNLGAGVLNAAAATERAMQLAVAHGIGCVALSNTNHWMRGGTYGYQAARAGYLFIGWTNTTANMPAWGAKDKRLGNNPLVLALPYGSEAIVLDIAMSQFSIGGLELANMRQQQLPVPGGYNIGGSMTTDPAEILASGRPLPAGYWKGAGLALLLDLMAVLLSGGSSTAEITQRDMEFGLSQVFIAISLAGLQTRPAMAGAVEAVMDDYRQSIPENEQTRISYPGERVLRVRRENLAGGIPVLKQVWEEISRL